MDGGSHIVGTSITGIMVFINWINNMDWKKFFKPTIFKIVLLLILPVIMIGRCSIKWCSYPLEYTSITSIPLITVIFYLILSLFSRASSGPEITQIPKDCSFNPDYFAYIPYVVITVNWLLACLHHSLTW